MNKRMQLHNKMLYSWAIEDLEYAQTRLRTEICKYGRHTNHARYLFSEYLRHLKLVAALKIKVN